MKVFFVCVLTLALQYSALADVPRPRVEFTSGYNGYGMISGRLESIPTDPVGITVEMSGFRYSTVTDQNGNWSLVIKHTSVNYSVESYSLSSQREKSEVLKAKFE